MPNIITHAPCSPKTLGGVQEKGTIEDGVYQNVWRDSYRVNSQTSRLPEHDEGDIWKAGEGFYICMFVIILPMDNSNTYVYMEGVSQSAI